MRISAIEIGTNSTKFIIAEKIETGAIVIKEKDSTVNRLSSKMFEKKYLTDEAMDKGIEIISNYSKLSKENDAALIDVFSTSVLRDAANRNDFIEKVYDAVGMRTKVLSGEEEAYFAYKSCSNVVTSENQRFLVIDIGGGSTELTSGTKAKIENRASLDIGAVRLTEMFVEHDPPLSNEIENVYRYADEKLREAKGLNAGKLALVGTGGTIKTLGTIYLNKDYKNESDIHGTVLDKGSIELIYGRLLALSIKERQTITGLNPKRADVIVTGIAILLRIMKNFGIEEIKISSQGVLEGYIEDYFLKAKI